MDQCLHLFNWSIRKMCSKNLLIWFKNELKLYYLYIRKNSFINHEFCILYESKK